MARARNIKPSFFTNGDLADCTPLTRLLFIGLWGISDREGRLPDKPRDIKAKVLPFDNCNVDELLWELEKTGFIRRYSAETQRGEIGDFIWLPRFTKHQHVHRDEVKSEIPEFKEEFNKAQIKPDKTGEPPPILKSDNLNAESLNLKDDIGSKTEEVKKETKHAKPLSTLEQHLGENPLIPDEWANWATGKFNLTPERLTIEWDGFCNHYIGLGSKWAVWKRVWQKWCNKSEQFAENRRRSSGAGGGVRGGLAAAGAFSMAQRNGAGASGHGVSGVESADSSETQPGAGDSRLKPGETPY